MDVFADAISALIVGHPKIEARNPIPVTRSRTRALRVSILNSIPAGGAQPPMA
jgi:hypothetical protein